MEKDSKINHDLGITCVCGDDNCDDENLDDTLLDDEKELAEINEEVYSDNSFCIMMRDDLTDEDFVNDNVVLPSCDVTTDNIITERRRTKSAQFDNLNPCFEIVEDDIENDPDYVPSVEDEDLTEDEHESLTDDELMHSSSCN
jgi:hypothetical protein